MQGITNYSEKQFLTKWRTTIMLCDLQRTASTNMHSSITYEEFDRPGSVGYSTQAGTALSGGSIFNGLDANNMDAVQYEAFGLDGCVSHSNP